MAGNRVPESIWLWICVYREAIDCVTVAGGVMRESGSESGGDALFWLRSVVGVGAGARDEDILFKWVSKSEFSRWKERAEAKSWTLPRQSDRAMLQSDIDDGQMR